MKVRGSRKALNCTLTNEEDLCLTFMSMDLCLCVWSPFSKWRTLIFSFGQLQFSYNLGKVHFSHKKTSYALLSTTCMYLNVYRFVYLSVYVLTTTMIIHSSILNKVIDIELSMHVYRTRFYTVTRFQKYF